MKIIEVVHFDRSEQRYLNKLELWFGLMDELDLDDVQKKEITRLVNMGGPFRRYQLVASIVALQRLRGGAIERDAQFDNDYTEDGKGIIVKPRQTAQAIRESMRTAQNDITNAIRILERAVLDLRPSNDYVPEMIKGPDEQLLDWDELQVYRP